MKATAVLPACLAAALGACAGLSEDERAVLDIHQQNSQLYFQNGSWMQALHQADMALGLEPDLVGMRLVKAHCLARLGTGRDVLAQLDEALALFTDLRTGDGEDDYRAWLGAGQAHLARARLLSIRGERIERRLASDFLTPEGRRDEQADFDATLAARASDLEQAERCLRHVLDQPLQQDNLFALIDLVLTLSELGGRDDEVLLHARRAAGLLVDAIELTRENLARNLKLSPRQQLDLQQRVEDDLSNEVLLRDIVITLEYNRGSSQRCLEEYAALEARGLMRPYHHFNRALVLENQGLWAQALADVQAFLRLQAKDGAYDAQVEQAFARQEHLEALLRDAPGS